MKHFFERGKKRGKFKLHREIGDSVDQFAVSAASSRAKDSLRQCRNDLRRCRTHVPARNERENGAKLPGIETMETGAQNGAKMGVEKRGEIGRSEQLLQDVQIVRSAQRVRFMQEIGDETVDEDWEFHRVRLEKSSRNRVPDDGESS